MIDPYDKRTLLLADAMTGEPVLHLAELIQAVESAAVPDNDLDGPKDDAARQRKARAKRKALGKKTVWLTDLERQALQCALELLHDIPAPGLAATLDAALEAVAPGAMWPAKLQAGTTPQRDDLRSANQLRKQVASLESEYAQCLTERGQAWEAIKILQDRLTRAGLSASCQPGELEQY